MTPGASPDTPASPASLPSPAPRRPATGKRRWRALRAAAAHRRNRPNDLLLGSILAFVAGAINAGGFLAIGQYTSHMTGIVSSIADNLALGFFGLVGTGFALIAFFIGGAASSAILIHWARRHARRQQYAYPLALEAGLLIVFAAIGLWKAAPIVPVSTALLLCYIMGLQNATITKISGARIRTTHLTGMITDIGIETGKLVYQTLTQRTGSLLIIFDKHKLQILLPITGMFFLGGLVGALGYKHLGHAFSLPIAALLLAVASPQLRSGRKPGSPPRSK